MVVRLVAVAVIAVVLGLGAAVSYIHRGAVARLEAENLIVANRVQRESTAEVLKLSENARQERDDRIVALEAELALLPTDRAGEGRACPSACKLVRTASDTPVFRLDE